MSVVFCAECNHVVSVFASGCRHCGAPISKSNPPPPVEPPPARISPVAKAATTAGVLGVFLLIAFDSGKGKVANDVLRRGPSVMPRTHQLATMVVPISGCSLDWRSCADNRDWVENADSTGPRGACLALVGAAAGYGHIALDHSWNGSRFASYVPGTSIRLGHIVLVDRAGLVRDAVGGWVPTPLHCTFDFGSRRARSVAPP